MNFFKMANNSAPSEAREKLAQIWNPFNFSFIQSASHLIALITLIRGIFDIFSYF
jgi:hypothetical protein